MKEFDEIPFVPCNDCTSWESCTQDAYEQGKADAKAEHDKECDTCILLGLKETAKGIKRQARKDVIDECKDALLLAISESYIWSEVCDAVKDKKIQLHTDKIYDDFADTIKKVLEKLKEQEE